MATEPEPRGETCQRCGSAGEDRRTLWMACFYAMDELPVPFTRRSIYGQVCEQAGEKRLEILDHCVPVWGDPQGDHAHHVFYCLRVCKRCRAEWMVAIVRWFEATPKGQDHDADEPAAPEVGSGIFLREHGAIREISREEWDRRAAEARKGKRG